MSNVYIFEGKTTNEAIEKGLKELKKSKKDVQIKVLENEEKRSFFSILTPRVVKVEITVNEKVQKEKKEIKKTETNRIIKINEENLEKAKENLEKFLNEFLNKLPSKEIEYEIKIENASLYVEIKGEDINYLIGYRGEVLNALQNVFSAIASKEIEHKIRVILDIYGYRTKREQALRDLAKKLAKTVIKTKKEVKLEPMSAYERKIIHEELQSHSKVETKSIGEEPNRKIIISLK